MAGPGQASIRGIPVSAVKLCHRAGRLFRKSWKVLQLVWCVRRGHVPSWRRPSPEFSRFRQ